MKMIIPKWIIIYLWILVLLTITFTFTAFLMPDILINTGKYVGESNVPLNLYLSRNIAIIVVYLFALFSQRIIVFKAVFILRGVIDLIDLLQDVVYGNIFELPFPLILLILDIFALVTLYRIKK
jgi:hypothetical protein